MFYVGSITMADIIPQHTHCHICSKSITVGETLCSDDCKQRYRSVLKKRKLMLYLMYGMIAALIVAILVSGSF